MEDHATLAACFLLVSETMDVDGGLNPDPSTAWPEGTDRLTQALSGLDHLAVGIPPQGKALAEQLRDQAAAQGHVLSPLEAGWLASQMMASATVPSVMASEETSVDDLRAYQSLPTLADLPMNDAEQAQVVEGRRRFWGANGILGWGTRALLSGVLVLFMGVAMAGLYTIWKSLPPLMLSSPLTESALLALKLGLPLAVGAMVFNTLKTVHYTWAKDVDEFPEAYIARRGAHYRTQVSRLSPAQRARLLDKKGSCPAEADSRAILLELAHGR